MSERDGRFVVCGLSDAEKKVLRITLIYKLWPSYSTKQEAIEAIKRGDARSISA